MSKGIRFERILQWFRETDIDVLDFVLTKGVIILKDRQKTAAAPKPVKRVRRKANGKDTIEAAGDAAAREMSETI